MPFTPIHEIGEFGLIERIQQVLGEQGAHNDLVHSIGDDAAVSRLADGRVQVMTADALVEGVHFDRTFTPLRHLGWKALSVNASDVVAMNAEPRWALVTIGLPNNISVEGVEALYRGIAEAAAHYGVTVAGGDITAAGRLGINVMLLGEADEAEIVTRSGAQVGDLLCVTGDVGSAAAGLHVLLAGKERMEAREKAFEGDGVPETEADLDLGKWAYVVERQLYPQARLDRVRAWKGAGVRPHALIDISDGLASETHHLCRSSVTGAVVDLGWLPLHLQTMKAAQEFEENAEAFALYGGEDYELLFALPEAEAEKLNKDSFAVVGRITEPEEGIKLRLPDGELVPFQSEGFDHF